MDQQALAAKLKHPTVKSFKNKPRHGHFNADDEGKAYTISVWCHSKYDNVFYYTSNGFDDVTQDQISTLHQQLIDLSEGLLDV